MPSALYVRTAYSLLQSLIKLPVLFSRAKAYGYNALAMVDRYQVHGAMSFYKQALKAEIKPIIGMSMDISDGKYKYELILYARNNAGFKNLVRLSSYFNTVSMTITPTFLKDYLADTLVAVTSISSIFTQDSAEVFPYLRRNYGDFYLGLSEPDYRQARIRNAVLKERAKSYGIKTFALPQSYYLDPDDVLDFKVLRAIKDKKTIDDKDLLEESGHEFKTLAALANLYSPEDLLNADRLAEKCQVNLIYKQTELPAFSCPQKVSSQDYLVALAKKGLELRLNGVIKPEYRHRLLYELKVIAAMHFEDYFLITYDYVRFAKKSGIYVGPGRGSAAGSLVSYCLGITEIDPLAYGLLFERFLNPERVTMPDIDIDFPDDRRDEVIAYVKEKYGADHVAHILTYGTLKAKQVIRDVARVFNYQAVDALAKSIPNDNKITLAAAYKTSRYFRDKVNFDRETQQIYQVALKLEGLPRHYSTHAAGIVLSKRPLAAIVPLLKVEDDLYSVGYTMEHLEALGLIKMDFLALRNLSIIDEIVREIKSAKGSTFSLARIPLDDPKAYQLLAKADTLGVFQLESSGMRHLLQRFKPQNFPDIALTIALFRPGPLENIPLFLKNRQDKAHIHYLHPDLKPILEETAGIIVYQEQIMEIARKMAGFSLAKADILRKAMAKKKANELAALQADFINGCLKSGYSKNTALELYSLILKFADYGFNKSHSVAYAKIAYTLVYLKANYPLYFYKALLNGTIGAAGKTYEYINECVRNKVKILGPDINESQALYQIEGQSLRMPLSIIKNVGNANIERIIQEKKEHGNYQDYQSTVLRLKKWTAKNVLESLINAGAFDTFALNRATMSANLAEAMKADLLMLRLDESFKLELKPVKEERNLRMQREFAALGFHFSDNPLQFLKQELGLDLPILAALHNLTGSIEALANIRNIREYTNERGRKIAYLTVEDDSGKLTLVLNENLYAHYAPALKTNRYRFILFRGEMTGNGRCRVQKMELR